MRGCFDKILYNLRKHTENMIEKGVEVYETSFGI